MKTAKPTKPKKLKTRVTGLSMSALFSLGNYENIKYEISVEVGAGESAVAAFQEVRYVLSRLKPLREPECASSFKSVCKLSEEERSEYQKAHYQEWADEMAEYHSRRMQRAEAIRMLDTLGGNSTHRDAKQSWESDDTPF
jgi:hypothetical protein